MPSLSDRRVTTIFAFVLASGLCGALLLARAVETGSSSYGFLVWNLVLAWIPFLLALAVYDAHRRRTARPWQLLLAGGWLLFLPNAPYIVTDFMHIEELPQVPLWYDVALIASCAGTGLLLGYSSLADVQAVIARKVSVRAGWAVALSALFLSGFGIYLGRFQRWNSWDAVANPLELFADIAEHILDPLYYSRTFGVTVIYGIALLLGYIALRVLRLTGNVAPDRS